MRLCHVLALAIPLLVGACGKDTPETGGISTTLTEQQVKALRDALTNANATLDNKQSGSILQKLVQADLPANATNVFGRVRTLFTQVIQLRFSCTHEELEAFLAASPRLSDYLRTEETGLLKTKDETPWWRPEELRNTKGSRQQWRDATEMVSADLLAGETAIPSNVTVYLMFVVENSK